MKKQILTLTMCLALTATSALAAGTTAVATKTTTKTKVTTSIKVPTKKVADNAKSKTQTQSIVNPATQAKLTPQEEAKKNFEARRASERELFYNNLGLSVEQKAKAEALDAKTKDEAGALIKKLHVEARKLKDLKVKKASVFAIWKQKQVVKAAKKDTDKFFETSKKSFEAILNDNQKAKLKLIDAQRKARMDKFRKGHKPGSRKMGPPPMSPEGPHGAAPRGPIPMGPAPATK